MHYHSEIPWQYDTVGINKTTITIIVYENVILLSHQLIQS